MVGLKLCVLWIALLGFASACFKETHGPCSCVADSDDGTSNVIVTCSGVTDDWLIKDALFEFMISKLEVLEIRDSPKFTLISDDIFDGKQEVKMLIMRNTGLNKLSASPFVRAGIADKLEVLSIVDSELETLDANIVNKFPNLKWLEFRRNSKLSQLSGTLTKNTELKSVVIADNPPFNVPGTFFKGLLSNITLSGNDLTKDNLPAVFETDATEIYASENNFVDGIPMIFKSKNPDGPEKFLVRNSGITILKNETFGDLFMSVQQTNLEDDMIYCDCDLAWTLKENITQKIDGECQGSDTKKIATLKYEDFYGCPA